MLLGLLIVGPFAPNQQCNPLNLSVCTRTLLSTKEILSDLVSTGTTRDGNRNYRTGFVLLEERNQRLHQRRLKPGRGVGNVRLHAKIAGQIDGRIAQIKRAAQINCDSRHLKSDSLCGKDTVSYPGLAVKR
jgi:hypothetical protein